MTDEELIARLRAVVPTVYDAHDAADRIDALVKERDSLLAGHRALNIGGARLQDRAETAEARAERLEAALREIAAEASVTVHTWKNGINFKKMYEGWRKIATERIDIARAALKGEDHE